MKQIIEIRIEINNIKTDQDELDSAALVGEMQQRLEGSWYEATVTVTNEYVE